MLKRDVRIGAVYAAKVSGIVCSVKVLEVSKYGGWDALNLRTHRRIRIKSAQKFRYLIMPAGEDKK